MRVVHLVPALFSHEDGIVGGAERYALELARSMANATPTSLLTFGNPGREESAGILKIKVIGEPWYIRGQHTNPFSLQLIAELRSADVIHCHQQHVLSSSVAAILGRLTGKRVFVTDLGGGGWDLSAYVSTDRWYRGHLHISQYSRESFGHSSSASAHVIYGGVDPDKFSPDGTVKRESTVVFVGRILPHKGVEHLIAALPKGTGLEVVGREFDPNYLTALKTAAAGKRVSFRHDCDDAAIVDAYRRAMCVALPSVHHTVYGDHISLPELLGQTLLEAMACSTPVLATRVASLPEIVEDGRTGFLVPPNDPVALAEKIRFFSEHPAQAAEFGLMARERVLDKYTWPAVVKRCLDIYAA